MLDGTRLKVALFDLDGTVYRGERLLPEIDRVIAALRDAGVQVRFLTNTATERRQTFANRLTEFGIPTEPADVINSGWVTARYLAEIHPDRTALVIGAPPLVAELEAHGIETTTDAPGEVVVASRHPGFTYRTLTLALRSIEPDTPFVATNPDRTVPTDGGEVPGAAGMIGAIEDVTGRSVDTILGKPSRRMLDAALDGLDCETSCCVVVGDRLDTDIAMASQAGLRSVLVLTGTTDRETLDTATIEPDVVVTSAADLLERLDPPAEVGDDR